MTRRTDPREADTVVLIDLHRAEQVEGEATTACLARGFDHGAPAPLTRQSVRLVLAAPVAQSSESGPSSSRRAMGARTGRRTHPWTRPPPWGHGRTDTREPRCAFGAALREDQMDDVTAGLKRARLLAQAMDRERFTLHQLWSGYRRLRGTVGQLEVEAYLHHCLRLPALQRDLLIHAANQLLDAQKVTMLPYTRDLFHGADTGYDE